MILTKLLKIRTDKMSAPTIFAPSDAFGQFRVKELSESDFALRTETPTAINNPDMHIILFYDPNGIEPEILDLWDQIARRVGGPTIGAVNMSSRREIMKAFFDVQADFDNPFNAYTGFQSPSILVYRKRWPQAFYNGEFSEGALIGWITQLAWKPGYRELDAFQSRDYQGPGPAQYYEDDQEQEFDDYEEEFEEEFLEEEPEEEPRREIQEEVGEEFEEEFFEEEPRREIRTNLLAERKPVRIADPGFL